MNKKQKLTLTGLMAAASLFVGGLSVNAETYTVQSGDTLSAIAKLKNTTVDKLVELNHILDRNMITVGQILELDGQASTEAVAETTVTSTETTGSETSSVAATTSADTSSYSSSVVLANGNTAGSTGAYAAAQMEAATGVSASTWEYIIAVESNGNPNAYNASGASGLFQTMPGWGSTATVEDQIQAAIRAYNAQGLAAWGM